MITINKLFIYFYVIYLINFSFSKKTSKAGGRSPQSAVDQRSETDYEKVNLVHYNDKYINYYDQNAEEGSSESSSTTITYKYYSSNNKAYTNNEDIDEDNNITYIHSGILTNN